MTRTFQPLPPFAMIVSPLGGITVQPKPIDQLNEFKKDTSGGIGIYVKFSTVDVNRVSYSGSLRLTDYGRNRGYELIKENPRLDTTQENCRKSFVMVKDGNIDAKVSDAAFGRLLAELLPAVNEWADENPGLFRSVKLADMSNKIFALEERENEKRDELAAISEELDDLRNAESAMINPDED